ncbi:uncharacterized protein PHACADRAFT_193554 [Phanerochaete carnosa HHB-10118-sp]|uniref:Uncharacterized protein n=1 Tax=Phanerochaete carnosa (strain HHB-10118-sp) TaxID=650164 RepID=K5V6T7_PHACS|nr:uncharacterized protein PHACADRAFT_193554 [Phanerochaete carnosa HHB-10118-sp]EKM58436.1 hypothetical protein PHACADRAFT_193554 [Phanerochaete carnosa HHB-10118-sp]
MVGYDWYTCQTSGFLGGITTTLQSGLETASAYYQTFPGDVVPIQGFSVSVGDNITISTTGTNTTSSTVVFINQSTNQTVSQAVNSGPLCDLLVGDSDQPSPFADFGTVNLTGASAETPSGPVGLSGATTLEIQQNDTVLASVLVSNSSLNIAYLQCCRKDVHFVGLVKWEGDGV